MGKESDTKSTFKYSRIDPQKNTRVVKIRDGTDDEELIGVRRVWGHPYRSKVKFHGSQEPVYYDIAIMELGMLIFLKNSYLFVWFMSLGQGIFLVSFTIWGKFKVS